MKIDLHCHTKSVKKGDGVGRNVSVELFRQKIIDSDVKIVAITNHNSFDLQQYIELKDVAKESCQIWPGVEIDISQDGIKRWHLIVVANPDNAEDFSQKIQMLFYGKDLETCTQTIQAVYEKLDSCDVIYISHFHKKPAIPEEDREELLSIVEDKSRVFDETADKRSLGVYANFNYNVLIGSDVKDWNAYESSTFADLRLPVSSFQQFCLLTKRDSVVINTLLNKKKSYQLMASPHKSVQFPLCIFEDINIIFGQKGTGKSEILNSLYLQMQSQGFKCEKYTGSDKDEDFKALLKTKDMEVDIAKVGAKDCKDEFKCIFTWTDANPTRFSNYADWYSTKDNNTNKQKMKITESTELVENEPSNLQIHREDKAKIKDISNIAKSVNIHEYLTQEETDRLTELIQKLLTANYNMFKADVIQIQACVLTNYTLTKVKSLADRNSNTVSRPSATGFREFAQSRLVLRRKIRTIISNISSDEQNERQFLGSLDGKGHIYINQKYRMLCHDSKTAEFPQNGIRSLNDISELLLKAEKEVFGCHITTVLSEFTDKCEENSIDSAKHFLGISKQIMSEDGAEYLPSNGEKGILLLQQKLTSISDAYFLDEPELGMGNSYIDTNIRPLISALAKEQKTVVIATHNANIAVRTLPYVSIFRTHKNGIYRTYIGNPFNDRLTNINDDCDIKSWTSESLHTLEGGKEAFYERKIIYESKGN